MSVRDNTTIFDLQTIYKPLKPPSTDKKHNEKIKNREKLNTGMIQKSSTYMPWHFTWWFTQGQAKIIIPVFSVHFIDSAYKYV